MKTGLIPQRIVAYDKNTITANESVADEAARGIADLEAFLAEQPVKATPALVYA